MNIRIANKSDLSILVHYDKHISADELVYSMMRERILIIEENNHLIGWLRYNLFWDNTPFMNMLYILEDYRGKRYGKVLTLFWEEKMKCLGYELVMTSTLSNEGAQHFYRKLGYRDAGSLLLPQEPLEIIFIKSI
ncbi:GNAT family N-acetyltransferase [Zhenhengia yiwuensis]|uniref:GNAT family N-acetyltransferase n=1 Tax=Zhenhengia yiwuensis TaxID=2763666 RepID=UPI0015B2D931|nr:GNAT family N-acetyltransferase [Zhenhengia yiwuensis]MDY3367963.1 GNAT family N-acetyltransferase [Zhenhengia yiwuensis]